MFVPNRMFAGSLPPSITHDARAYLYVPVSGLYFDGVLAIRQGDECDVYGVEEFPPDCITLSCDLLRFFALVSCDVESESPYCVTVDSSGIPICARCTCFGFNRWGNCKHADSILHLYNDRRI